METEGYRHLRHPLLKFLTFVLLFQGTYGQDVFTYLPGSPVLFTQEVGNRVWLFTLGGTLGFLDKDRREFRPVLNQSWGASNFFWSQEASRVGMVSQGRILLWDWEENRLILDLDPGEGIQGSPVLSPEGSLLAFVSSSFLTLMDLDSQKIFRRFPGVEGILEFKTAQELRVQPPGGNVLLLDIATGNLRNQGVASPPPPTPAPVNGALNIPQGSGVKNLSFEGSDPLLTLEFQGHFFSFSSLEGWKEAGALELPPRLPPLPPPSGLQLPPFALHEWNQQHTLLAYTGFNNSLQLSFLEPGAPEALNALYHIPYLKGSPETLVMSDDGQWLALGDDMGFVLLWHVPSGRPVGLWNFYPVLTGGIPETLQWAPFPGLQNWDPRVTPFPAGVLALPPTAWGSGSQRVLPWSDSLPKVLTNTQEPGMPGGFILPQVPGSSGFTSPEMLSTGDFSYILQPGGNFSRLIRLGSDGNPDLTRILPGQFSKIRPYSQGLILTLGSETVAGSGGKSRLLIQILNSSLETQSAYRSFFLVDSLPQVQSGEGSEWAGFHWSERSRNSWTSTLKFYNFFRTTAWSIQIPLALDLTGSYDFSRPEVLSRNTPGTFILPLAGTMNLRNRESGTAFVTFDPGEKKLSSLFLPLASGISVPVVGPGENRGLLGISSLGILRWPEGKTPTVWPLPGVAQDRGTLEWWSGTKEADVFPLQLGMKQGFGQPISEDKIRVWWSESELNPRFLIHQNRILAQIWSKEKDHHFLWISPEDTSANIQEISRAKGLPSGTIVIDPPYYQNQTPLLWDWEPMEAGLKFESPVYSIIPAP